jgi:hypothetical protein
MKTTNIVIVASLIIVGLLFGLFWVVAPALMKDKVVSLITSESAERQCFNYYKNEINYFTDPDSAYIESSHILPKNTTYKDEGHYDSIIEVKVFAHNKMGGYVSDTIDCPLSKNYFSNIDTAIYLLDKQNRKSTIENCEKMREKFGGASMGYNLDAYFEENCR